MTITDTPTITGLTPDDIAAIRHAECVVFRGYHGEFTIEVSIDRHHFDEQPAIFTAKEQRLYPVPDRGMRDQRHRVITVTGTVSGFELRDGDSWGSKWQGDENSTGFAMIHTAKYDHAWLTVAGLLRAGDQVHLSFDGDAYSNGNTKPHGLHADRLTLNVRRDQTKPPLVFPVDVSVCLDNSARMVRRFG